MTRKICIITPGTIASNPRLVKEAEALTGAGYKVHLIYTRHVGYLIKTDQQILDYHHEWTYDYLDWVGPDLKAKFYKLVSGLKRKVANSILNTRLYPAQAAAFLINRFYHWQLNKAISVKADLYIAHYPESIAIAAKAAKINNAFFAYDAEDYHRGEDLPAGIVKVISKIEDMYLHDAAYITAASPLIGQVYEKLFPEVKVVPVENMFPLKRQVPFVSKPGDAIKFFWFSQTIGPKRGLEQFITILSYFPTQNIHLTLLGNVSDLYKHVLKELWTNARLKIDRLKFLYTVSEEEIFKIAANHHIGLCLEIPSVPNKDFCISNKLYTYLLSGNFLIMSQTKAQNNFHKSYPETGISIDLNNTNEAAAQILKLLENEDLLEAKRRQNYELAARTLNFDCEKKILLKQVESLWE